MMDQRSIGTGLAGIQRLLKRVQDKVRRHRRTDPPAYNAPGKNVHHEGYDNQPCHVETYVKSDTHS